VQEGSDVSFRLAALGFLLALPFFVAPSLGFAQEAAPAAEATAPAPPAVTFTGGATAITETHRDWIVNCSVQQDAKVCFISQSLSNNANGQRLFTIELRLTGENKIEGGMLLPFGLRLNAGVSMALDDEPLGESVAFTTCTQQGCLAPFAAEGDALAALQAGQVLKIGSVSNEGENVIFAVSLAGFTSALDRAEALPQ
jgi:invasion protein IalB